MTVVGGNALLETCALEFSALESLFEITVSYGMSTLTNGRYVKGCNDERVNDLVQEVQNIMRKKLWDLKGCRQMIRLDKAALKCNEVNSVAMTSFPPCMERLHKRLRTTHRFVARDLEIS